MTVQIRSDKLAIRVDPPITELDFKSAVDLARDLIDAVTQCGYEVKMDVEVPRRQPTDAQLAQALHRVGHIRRTGLERAWNDQRTNMEIVARVLEACL